MDWTLIEQVVVPMVVGAVSWWAGNRKRRNDFLGEMQSSIDLLTKENSRLLADNLELRKRLVDLELIIHKMEKR